MERPNRERQNRERPYDMGLMKDFYGIDGGFLSRDVPRNVPTGNVKTGNVHMIWD
jgi:hypothetical protein